MLEGRFAGGRARAGTHLASPKKDYPVFASHISLWPLVIVLGGAVGASVVRYLVLFIGLRLALKDARPEDRSGIFGEFARAVAHRPARPWQTGIESQTISEKSGQSIPEPSARLEATGGERGS